MALVGASNEMDATKRDELLNLVQKELKFSAKLAGFFQDVSRFAVKGNKSISFPKLGSFTAATRAAGAAFAEQVVSSTADQLDLDQIVGVHYIIDPSEALESVLDWEFECAQKAASAVARNVDNALITELETVGEAIVATGDITRDIILGMRETLVLREADLESEGVLIVSADSETALLKIAEFKDQDIYGPNGAVMSGRLGSIYGMPVMRHTGLAAQTYFMTVRSALVIGFQKAPSMGSQPAVEYGADAEKHVIDTKYGVKGMQIEQGGAAAGKSAWVIKDNN